MRKPRSTNGEQKLLSPYCEKKLSKFEKSVLGLYLDGKSYQEISVVLKRTAKSIDNALQRIRKKLSDM